MAHYRNQRTGRVVDIPDDPPTKQDLPGRQDQWENYVRQIRRSSRWVRTDEPPTPPREATVIPPAYLDPGDGSAPYPIPPAHIAVPGQRGTAVHPGYQAGVIHEPTPAAYGRDDRVSPYLDDTRHQTAQRARRAAEANPAVDDVEAATRMPGMQYDVEGRRGPDAEKPPGDVTTNPAVDADEGFTPDIAPGVPDVSDRKAAWIDYAVSRGQTRADAEDMTKAELVEKYKS